MGVGGEPGAAPAPGGCAVLGLVYVSASCPFQKRWWLVLRAPVNAADPVQTHSASSLSQQILIQHLVRVSRWISPWGCSDEENKAHGPQKLTPGQGETPVMMECEEFSRAGGRQEGQAHRGGRNYLCGRLFFKAKPSQMRHAVDSRRDCVPLSAPWSGSDPHLSSTASTSCPLHGQSSAGHFRASTCGV